MHGGTRNCLGRTLSTQVYHNGYALRSDAKNSAKKQIEEQKDGQDQASQQLVCRRILVIRVIDDPEDNYDDETSILDPNIDFPECALPQFQW